MHQDTYRSQLLLTTSKLRFIPGAALVALLDQAAKFLVVRCLAPGESAAGFQHARNPDAAFGYLDGLDPWVRVFVFFVLPACALGGMIFALGRLGKTGGMAMTAGLSLLAGGAMSNLLDRVLRGHVVDYIVIPASKMTWNLGDFCIIAGIFLMAFSLRKPLL